MTGSPPTDDDTRLGLSPSSKYEFLKLEDKRGCGGCERVAAEANLESR